MLLKGKSTSYSRVMVARNQLLMDQPFFGTLAMKLKLAEDKACSTVWSNATTLGFNPVYVDKISDLELRALIAKLVLHIAAGHPWRQGGRNAVEWNQAASFAINPVVEEAGYRLPSGSLNRADFKGLPAELIYETILKEKKENEDSNESDDSEEGNDEESPSSSSPGGVGEQEDDCEDTPSMPAGEIRPAEEGELEADWKMALETAERMQGALSAGLDRFVANAKKASVNWKEVLWSFAEQCGSQSRRVWRKPNKRWLAQGLYLPGKVPQQLRSIVIARDTSGSVDNTYLSAFNAEILDIIGSCRPEEAFIVDCDSAIAQVIEINAADMPDSLPAKGGGGTDFRPVFKWIEEQGVDPQCVIYLTDLAGSFPSEEPDYPVLWAVPEGYCSSGKEPPFGTKLSISV